MHELSIARRILQIAEQRAAGRVVARVRVEVGALGNVSVDALRFAFEVCARHAGMQAQLDLDVVEGHGRCGACGLEIAMQTLYDRCHACDGALDILRGEELLVRDLEIQDVRHLRL